MAVLVDVARTLPERSAALGTHLTLALGAEAIALDGDDRAAADWLAECLDPWFVRTTAPAGLRVTVSSSARAYADLAAQRPADTAARSCFALDQQVVALPAWTTPDGIVLADAKRSCFLIVDDRASGEIAGVTVVGDPTSLRWRFTLQLVFLEAAATWLRRTSLDMHAAAVESGGRGILLVGPKRAGKTTLSLHLLRSGGCRWIANDRAYVGRGDDALVIRGIPAAVKIQPATLRSFPELSRGIDHVERPYLHSLEELDRAPASPRPSVDMGELALSPAQLARQLAVEPLAAAPLGAIVFPEIRGDVGGFAVERLEPARVAAALRANLYGQSTTPRATTIFEALDGGRSTLPPGLTESVAERVPGYRILLGPGAYALPGFAAQVLEALLP